MVLLIISTKHVLKVCNFRPKKGRSFICRGILVITIEWDVKTPSGIAIRDKLMSVNPRGKDAGLTYYSGETDITTEKTKIKIKKRS